MTIAVSRHLTLEDLEWLDSMLTTALLSDTIKIACGCGFLSECYMHCNHSMPECPGPSYKDNGQTWPLPTI